MFWKSIKGLGFLQVLRGLGSRWVHGLRVWGLGFRLIEGATMRLQGFQQGELSGFRVQG